MGWIATPAHMMGGHFAPHTTRVALAATADRTSGRDLRKDTVEPGFPLLRGEARRNPASAV